jgi:hypothetical protein
LNVNASPTLSANPTKYPGLSVVSGNFETWIQIQYRFKPIKHQDMGYVWCPPLIPVLVFSCLVDDLHLDYEHALSNLVLETIDYLVHLSFLKVLENVTLSTSHHSIQQGFAKDYAVLSIYQQ